MEEAKSSWNTVYQSNEGFECQITLRDEDETNLAQRASRVMTGIVKSGGIPSKRKGFESNNHTHENANSNEELPQEKNEKTFIDDKGVRRCNKKLQNGTSCGAIVVEKQGKYGPFWSCPNYKQHAA